MLLLPPIGAILRKCSFRRRPAAIWKQLEAR